MKIKILMPYYGALPRWFPFFLHTCRYNPKVVWHFVSDHCPGVGLPSNVLWTKMTSSEFGNYISDKLSLNTGQIKPFKICDFRPAFGEIFSDFLGGFDYWGWGDVDVLYGDLSAAFDRISLTNYDVLGVRSEFIPGELTLVRNTKRINNLFRESKDFKRILTTPENFNFCELGFFGAYRSDREIQSFTEVVYRRHVLGELKALLRDMGHNDRKTKKGNINFLWDRGKLWDLRTGCESVLYHFLDLKKTATFNFPEKCDGDTVQQFLVSQNGLSVVSNCRVPTRNIFPAVVDCLHRRIRAARAARRLRRMVVH